MIDGDSPYGIRLQERVNERVEKEIQSIDDDEVPELRLKLVKSDFG